MKIAVRADKYFNNMDKWDGFPDVQPVDLNAGLVLPKQDKYGVCQSCGDEVEDNIRERFGMETPEVDNNGGGEQ